MMSMICRDVKSVTCVPYRESHGDVRMSDTFESQGAKRSFLPVEHLELFSPQALTIRTGRRCIDVALAPDP